MIAVEARHETKALKAAENLHCRLASSLMMIYLQVKIK
jgi:hypothetical protein